MEKPLVDLRTVQAQSIHALEACLRKSNSFLSSWGGDRMGTSLATWVTFLLLFT